MPELCQILKVQTWQLANLYHLYHPRFLGQISDQKWQIISARSLSKQGAVELVLLVCFGVSGCHVLLNVGRLNGDLCNISWHLNRSREIPVSAIFGCHADYQIVVSTAGPSEICCADSLPMTVEASPGPVLDTTERWHGQRASVWAQVPWEVAVSIESNVRPKLQQIVPFDICSVSININPFLRSNFERCPYGWLLCGLPPFFFSSTGLFGALGCFGQPELKQTGAKMFSPGRTFQHRCARAWQLLNICQMFWLHWRAFVRTLQRQTPWFRMHRSLRRPGPVEFQITTLTWKFPWNSQCSHFSQFSHFFLKACGSLAQRYGRHRAAWSCRAHGRSGHAGGNGGWPIEMVGFSIV